MSDRLSSPSNPKNFCTGYELKEMFSVATNWFEKNAPAINALNVFPVPDGDTGTNMLLTLRSTLEEAARVPENNASVVAKAMAQGALMGARGNSGVILSQIFKGIAEGLDDAVVFGCKEMALAFEKAYRLAYQALIRPQEGTILTVVKDVARAVTSEAKRKDKDLIALLEVAVQEAKRSVERTPELLDILKEAGVVDAGGQGFYIILEGIYHYLCGDAEKIILLETIFPTTLPPAFLVAKSQKEKIYGYCTEFIIKGDELNSEQIRDMIETKGDSVLVAGDQKTIKIHIHTPHPGAILEIGTSFGSLHDLKIQNMDDQRDEFIQMRRAPVPVASIAIVSVVSGKGLEEVFRSLGTTGFVSGGQSMNPSTEEILRAVDSLPSDKVIVLPNNSNVILTAKQSASLSRKKVEVLPTKSIPQGLAALLAFNTEMELENNLSEMSKALQRVKSIEITRAVRDARVGSLNIKEGEFIGIIDGEITNTSDNLLQAVINSLNSANVEKAEIVTFYYGADVSREEAENLAQSTKSQHRNLQFEVIKGDQPHYYYIISVE